MTPMSPIRVLVVDSHGVFVDALAVRLAEEPDLLVAGQATTVHRARRLVEESTCDVVTLGLSLDGDDGIDLAREMIRRRPGLGVVIVTDSDQGDRVVEAVQAGARGWISKRATSAELVAAIRSVARGETFIPADLLTGVLVTLTAGECRHASPEGLSHLTQRELDVLDGLVDGLARAEIAERLHVSPNTVRTHVQSILTKLHVHSALAAVAVARRAGIGALPDERTPPIDVPGVGRSGGSPPADRSYRHWTSTREGPWMTARPRP